MTAPTKDRVTTVTTASGLVTMQIITPEGFSATSQFNTRAEAFAKIDWLRSHLRSDAPLVRGLAAERREERS